MIDIRSCRKPSAAGPVAAITTWVVCDVCCCGDCEDAGAPPAQAVVGTAVTHSAIKRVTAIRNFFMVGCIPKLFPYLRIVLLFDLKIRHCHARVNGHPGAKKLGVSSGPPKFTKQVQHYDKVVLRWEQGTNSFPRKKG